MPHYPATSSHVTHPSFACVVLCTNIRVAWVYLSHCRLADSSGGKFNDQTSCKSWPKIFYLQVQEDDYGLSTTDIVSLSDKDLNQLVGLRNLAPYRDAYNQKKGRRDTIHRLKALKAKPSQVCRSRALRLRENLL
jgi:hypothetical protein